MLEIQLFLFFDVDAVPSFTYHTISCKLFDKILLRLDERLKTLRFK